MVKGSELFYQNGDRTLQLLYNVKVNVYKDIIEKVAYEKFNTKYPSSVTFSEIFRPICVTFTEDT